MDGICKNGLPHIFKRFKSGIGRLMGFPTWQCVKCEKIVVAS